MKYQAKEPGTLAWGIYDSASLEADLRNGHVGRHWRFRLLGNLSEMTADELLARAMAPEADVPAPEGRTDLARTVESAGHVNDRFPVLSFVSLLLRVFGWTLFAVGIVCLVLMTVELFSGWQGPGLMTLVPGAAFGVFGLILIALGESIGVLFAIEANTRRAARR